MKAILQSLLFVLVFSVCGSATAQAQAETQTQAQDSKQPPSVEINSIVLQQLFDLQDRVNRLEYSRSATDSIEQNKEIELLKQQLNQLTQSVNLQHGKLSNQVDQYEGRISDIGASVDKYTTVLGWFGIVAGILSVVITGITLIFSSQSKKLAVESAKEQLEIYSEEIKSDLSEQLKNEINLHREKWEEHITNLLMDSEKRIEDLEQKIKKILNESHDYLERIKKLAQKAIEKELTEEEKEEYQISTFKLRQKPESEFTPDDWYQLGVDEYTRNNYPKAMEYFELSERHIDAKDIDVASSLFAKALCLNLDGRLDEEVSIYDNLITRFESSEISELQELVGLALYNKSNILDQKKRPNEALAVYDDLIARFLSSDQLKLQETVAMALYNKSIILGEERRLDEAAATYDYLITRFEKKKLPGIKKAIEGAIINRAELSILREPKNRSERRINNALDSLDSSVLASSIMSFLLFLLDKTDIDNVLQNVEDLAVDTEFTWRSIGIKKYLNQFSGVKGQQVQAFVRFFEEHNNVEKLKEELEKIKGDK
ncbi:hypothetical protein [Bacterioplanoides sp.]|uniref:hypothetical protein n=1 Tax=Bacterioplanoides sp. TaxID=2066072 RepID=UPI003AFF67B8